MTINRSVDVRCDAHVFDECLQLRSRLIDKLSDLDDQLAEIILERESLDKVTCAEIQSALRRITIERVF
jgi:hypothetical protein